jgi:hypothetical protein
MALSRGQHQHARLPGADRDLLGRLEILDDLGWAHHVDVVLVKHTLERKIFVLPALAQGFPVETLPKATYQECAGIDGDIGGVLGTENTRSFGDMEPASDALRLALMIGHRFAPAWTYGPQTSSNSIPNIPLKYSARRGKSFGPILGVGSNGSVTMISVSLFAFCSVLKV